jgi:prevent-host-death family protein
MCSRRDSMATRGANPDRHMGVAEVKRRFADVIGEVMHTGRRVVVERRGRPVVAIVPLEGIVADQLSATDPAVAEGPLSEETFAEFERVMKYVLSLRRHGISGEGGADPSPGPRLAELVGFGGEAADHLWEEMQPILRERRQRMPRRLPEFDE